MPKKSGSEPRSRQLLLRLTVQEHDVLAAQAYLEGVTPTELAREQLGAYVAVRARTDRVQRLLRERQEYEAERTGRLKSIDAKRPAGGTA